MNSPMNGTHWPRNEATDNVFVGDSLQTHHQALSGLTIGLFTLRKPQVPWIGLLLIILHPVPVSPGMETRCDAPSVTIGDTATITCHFSSNVQNEARYTVDHYNFSTLSTGIRDNILLCDKHLDKFECNTPKSGYRYQYSPKQTTSINITITSAGVQHEGRYVCSTFGQQSQDIKPCNFTLKDVKPTPATFSPEPTTRGMHGDNTTTERSPNGGNGGSYTAVYIGIGVMVAVLGVAGIVSFLFRKRLIRYIHCLPCFKGITEGTQDNTQGANLPLRPTGVPPAAAEKRSEESAPDEPEHVIYYSDEKSNDD